MSRRTFPDRQRWRSTGLLPLLFAFCALAPSAASAKPKIRVQIDQKGDVILIGNTLGQDCRAGVGIPAPIVGTVGNCGTDAVSINDSAPDVFWNASDNGTAVADDTVTVQQARSAAMLQLAAGQRVTYARLYWAGVLDEDLDSKNPVTLDRPGAKGFSVSVRPIDDDVKLSPGGPGGHVFQASADVTAVVQRYGAGVYRVSSVAHSTLLNQKADVLFAAWSLVIFYQDNSKLVRNLALFDGMDFVDTAQTVSLDISGFNVPTDGIPDAKLGVIAYEGDPDLKDKFTFNNKIVSDAINGSENFFNGSHTLLGMPFSLPGDLPQLTGGQASMSGVDLDVADISTLVMPGDTGATIAATSVDDIFYVGAMFTSIRSRKPVIVTTLDADPSSVRPGDTVEFTSTTVNVGDDGATGLILRHPIPDGMTFVPGSVNFISGPDSKQNGVKTDKAGDDQAEIAIDPMTNKPVLIVRLGRGAGGAAGGSLQPNDPPVVIKYKLKTVNNAPPQIPNQSTTIATPESKPSLGPATFPSGNPSDPGAPTIVYVPNKGSDLRVTVTKTPDQPAPQEPTTYGVDVTNVGNTEDQGPIKVQIDIPKGGTIDKVTPGPGWTCTQNDRRISCTLPTKFPAGQMSHAVDVVVRQPITPTDPPGPGTGVHVITYSEGAYDTNPADNEWDEFGNNGVGARVAGGAFGCTLSSAAHLGGLSAWAVLGAALGLATMLRRRRQGASH